MPKPYCLDYRRFIISLEIRDCQYFNFVLFQSYFGYSRSFAFPYGFQNQYVIFYNKASWDLVGFFCFFVFFWQQKSHHAHPSFKLFSGFPHAQTNSLPQLYSLAQNALRGLDSSLLSGLIFLGPHFCTPGTLVSFRSMNVPLFSHTSGPLQVLSPLTGALQLHSAHIPSAFFTPNVSSLWKSYLNPTPPSATSAPPVKYFIAPNIFPSQHLLKGEIIYINLCLFLNVCSMQIVFVWAESMSVCLTLYST